MQVSSRHERLVQKGYQAAEIVPRASELLLGPFQDGMAKSSTSRRPNQIPQCKPKPKDRTRLLALKSAADSVELA